MGNLPLTVWRALYAAALPLAWLWVIVRLRVKARREPEYAQRSGERFGRVPAGIPRQPVWFHTVSAGEVIAAAQLIERLAGEFAGLDFLVTTTTPTGSAQVQRLLTDKLNNVFHCYAPFDFPHAVDRFFNSVEPRLLVLMETELWPNTIARAAQRGVPVLLINGRLSDRSARGYQRMAPLCREMLCSMRFIAAQSSQHADRFLALGAPPDRVGVCGSLKFDVSLPPGHAAAVAELRRGWPLDGRFVWAAGSTHAGEDATVIAAHRQLLAAHPSSLLVLAPRHPVRADGIARQLEAAGLEFVRRSGGEAVTLETSVLLLDTLGELPLFYGISDVAFLGGSLVSVGGHNPIEAAICGQPLLIGPHTFNFPDVVAAFADAGALTLVADAAALATALAGYAADPELRARRGRAAREVVLANRGAASRLESLLCAEIRAVSPASGPSTR